MAIGVSKTGEWQKAITDISAIASPGVFQRAMRKTLQQDGIWLRKQIVTGIRKQAPAGKKFKPLAASSVATRRFRGFRGQKALIRSGDLRNSIQVKMVGTAAFVGALRSKRSRDGRSLANIARAQEFGTKPKAVTITPKMRRFLFAMLRTTKATRGVAGAGGGVIIIKIPPRPFLRPVFDKFGAPSVIRPRLMARLQLNMKGKLGRPDKNPPK